jgi:predicted RNA polymerase sigma factor
VQDAFLRAVTEWSGAAPTNPEGWIHQLAKNLALDAVRRERMLVAREDDLKHALREPSAPNRPAVPL